MTRDHTVLNIDVAPTIVAAARRQVPERMQGRDFSALYLSGRAAPWRDEFFYEHPTITSRDRIPSSVGVIRRDWKYVHWPEFDYEQLFDLKKDPEELRNLALEPASDRRRATMRAKLEEWRVRAK